MAAESVETHGRTTEEAIRAALEELGVGRDEVEIEILHEGRSGVFGVGSQEARVRVTLLAEEYDEDEEEEQPGPLRAAEESYEDEEWEEDEDEPQPTLSDEDAELARDALEHMLDLLEFPNLVTVKDVEHGDAGTTLALDVAGEDVGLLIGRHGETLQNLQFLLNALVRRRLPRNTRIMVDVEHYRERREQSLRGIAMRTADRVRRDRRSVTLQPMPPNERRIIHLTLQSSPWVMTESTGEGPERRVVVSPKPGSAPRGGYSRGPAPRGPSYGGGGGGYRRG
ncbi:MAG: spoIIIJ-associated protein [Chloroflexota bacterium]|jgi:spoIIIJ-associated protein|nr:spoIIIJ-associated protein [Chloroflexota bacterium]